MGLISIPKFCIAFVGILVIPTLMAQNRPPIHTISFDSGWSFKKDTSSSGPERIDFDASSWRKVNVPHDWSIEDINGEKDNIGPFSKTSIGRAATGWTVGGTGWYRKQFVTEHMNEYTQVSICFDGVYMNSDVWINDRYLGNHPYGYTPFYYDLTPYLKPVGQKNVIAVRVRNEGKNSRWYSGSGIYRHVWLNYKEPVHVDTWGVYITTPEVSQDRANIHITTKINNKLTSAGRYSLATTIVDSNGENIASSKNEIQLAAGRGTEENQSIVVQKPALWSLEAPVLYKAITEIKDSDKVVDKIETYFGIRTIVFDGINGFSLNGKKLILKGGCIHHDNGPLGAAAFDRAEERKIEILKKNGYNAIRTSHNPPSPQLLDACDRLGILVLDEAFDTWLRPKNPSDYNLYFNEWWQKDLDAMILRDRNHPSVIMWSIGNEIYEAPDLLGQELSKKLVNEVHKLDPTRPVTEAIVYVPPYTIQPLVNYIPHLENLDVDGYNYFLENKSIYTPRDSTTFHFFDIQHATHPNKAYVVTESYPYFALENYEKSQKDAYVIGSFKWTAFDYLGEAGLGVSRLKLQSRPILKGLIGLGQFFRDEWPIFVSGCGDFDLIGDKKPASYYQDVVWGQSPIEMFVHTPIPDEMREIVAAWGFPDLIKSWTWPGQEGKKMQIHVYSRSKVVKLELNGRIIAEQIVPKDSIITIFNIDYQPGTLIAKGYDNGVQTCQNHLTTVDKPVAIRLVADRKSVHADPNDLSYINVEVVDRKGNVVPNLDDLEIAYEVKGNASIAALGNGNVRDMSSFQQHHKKVFHGRGLVILRPTGVKGEVTLKATATGLRESSVQIKID